MERDKLIFFGVIGSVLVLLVLYIALSFGKDKSGDLSEQAFETPEMDIENKKYDYNSRIAALTDNRYEDDTRNNQLKYSFTQETEQVKEDLPKETPNQVKEKAPKQKKKASPQKNTSAPKAREKIPVKQKQPEEDNSVSVSYSFSSGSSNQVSQQSEKATGNHKMIWAQLDDKVNVKHNSNQVFLLEKGGDIAGRYFPGNSKLYTRAVTESNYIDIQVYRIKDINTGQEYSVSLYAINEDRGRGIKYQGKQNKEGDKARNNVLSETMRSVSRRYDVSDVGQAVGEGVEDIAQRDKIEVPLSKGYRLIFVEN